jgi:hypothetical protein
MKQMAHDYDDQEDGGHDDGKDISRRHALECMLWAGTGVLWAVSGGVPKSLSLLGRVEAATAASSFTFLQISDSHVGFDKAANPNALGTLQEAISKVKAIEAGRVRQCRASHRHLGAQRALCARRA